MSRYPYEEFTRIDWAPVVTTISAPTVAQLTAAAPLSLFIASDGLTPPSNQNMVPADTIAQSYDAESVGSFGGGFALRMYRDNDVGGDDAWDICVYKSTGFLIIRRGFAWDLAYAAGQEVEVWPGQIHKPVMNQSARNVNQSFNVMIAVTRQPNDRALVAA